MGGKAVAEAAVDPAFAGSEDRNRFSRIRAQSVQLGGHQRTQHTAPLLIRTDADPGDGGHRLVPASRKREPTRLHRADTDQQIIQGGIEHPGEPAQFQRRQHHRVQEVIVLAVAERRRVQRLGCGPVGVRQ